MRVTVCGVFFFVCFSFFLFFFSSFRGIATEPVHNAPWTADQVLVVLIAGVCVRVSVNVSMCVCVYTEVCARYIVLL